MPICPGVQIIVWDRLGFLEVGFEANAGKKFNNEIDSPLKECWISRCQIRIINVKNGEKGLRQVIDLLLLQDALLPQSPKRQQGC